MNLLPLGTLHEQLTDVLTELRESLHRRGRLSSRNEALEEMSKFLFAHEMLVFNENTTLADSISSNGKGIASSLCKTVNSTLRRYIPTSLTKEIPVEHFLLRMNENENLLAEEIVACFRSLKANDSGEISFDLINEVFGRFLSNSFAEEKELGQYLTPREVVQFMVKLAIASMTPEDKANLREPVGNETIVLDPSCGVGSFLAEFLHEAKTAICNSTDGEMVLKWNRAMAEHVLVGIDKSERMLRLAFLNLALCGFPVARLHLASALHYGKEGIQRAEFANKASIILTNPPFGAEFQGKDLSDMGLIASLGNKTTLNSELLFIDRYIDWLKPGGQLVAILPDSILTNKGSYRIMRDFIKDRASLETIISLPSETFAAAGTSAKTSIVHFRKLPLNNGRVATTYFAVCHEVGFKVLNRGAIREKVPTNLSDLPQLLLEATTAGIPKIGRRVVTAANHERWDAQFHCAEQLSSNTKGLVLVRDVADLVKCSVNPQRLGKKHFLYLEIANVDADRCIIKGNLIECKKAPSRARLLVKAGDVLFSTVRPDRGAIAVVAPDQDGAVCTTGFAVLRPRGIQAGLLAFLLKTDFAKKQILRHNTGMAYPVVSEECLCDIILPVSKDEIPELEVQASHIFSEENKLANIRTSLVAKLTDLSQEKATR